MRRIGAAGSYNLLQFGGTGFVERLHLGTNLPWVLGISAKIAHSGLNVGAGGGEGVVHVC